MCAELVAQHREQAIEKCQRGHDACQTPLA